MNRELKKQNTRLALSRVAIELALELGFDGFTVDRVAAEVGVSRRTFFRYFDTKEAAFFAGHEERLVGFRAALSEGRPGELPYDTVRRCLLEFAQEYDANRQDLSARHRCVQASRQLLLWDLGLDRRFEEAIVDTLRADERLDELRALVLGSAVFGVVRALLRPWLDGDLEDPLTTLGARALDLLEEGFRCERGEAVHQVRARERRAAIAGPTGS